MLAGGLLSFSNLLLAEDLNFTISSSEVWGCKARIDPLAPYFSQLISSNNLVDLSMNLPNPTWRNGSSGDVGIIKRLDQFLLSGSLLPILACYRTWETPTDVSNHYPIFLEWGSRHASLCFPFKFNRAWLVEDDFAPLVLSSWKTPLDLDGYSHMDVFTLKLCRLKCTVKEWERMKNHEMKLQILDINEGISNILLEDSGLLSASNADKLKVLQARKGKY